MARQQNFVSCLTHPVEPRRDHRQNDALMVGPIVQEELRSIIMRSRIHAIMLIADIEQMFRQIRIDERDTPLQRIVWRSSPEATLSTYELKTVTYGTASAPFLATRVLRQLADDEQHPLFRGRRRSTQGLLRGRPVLPETLYSAGGFELRKWASSVEEVLEGVPPEHRALKTSVDLDRDECIKSLGLHWEPATDQLRYKIDLPSSNDTQLTKRIALSPNCSYFYPPGLVGPVITTAKLFMQALWTLKANDGNIWGWDQELPPTYKERWFNYMSQLPYLNDLRIERYILCSNPSSIQLHFFSDASENAYGACCYIRSSNSNGETKTALLTTKSKVAPLKQQSIPRLELCGALLSAELYEKVTSSLQIPTDTYFWVDSTIVILLDNKILLTIYLVVLSAENLLHDELWWRGPHWLVLQKKYWPIQQAINSADSILEARKPSTIALSAVTEPSFIDDLATKEDQRPSRAVITAEDLHAAEMNLIRLVQQQSFTAEWNQLERSQPVGLKSRIRWFHPFISVDKIIRIGGELKTRNNPMTNPTWGCVLKFSAITARTLLVQQTNYVESSGAISTNNRLRKNVLLREYDGVSTLQRPHILEDCFIDNKPNRICKSSPKTKHQSELDLRRGQDVRICEKLDIYA
ncbi:uncharacterized protein LOC134204708 [Armigeres subalbatus]|uniref:uncharacterized protein LOC134204708 n=1 Tax=Armigeres subalbatus TaxID=124917 RepID=UPI002ED63E54